MKDMKMIVDETLKVLKEGGIILYPTDTIWGLGCDATNPEAVAKIYEIKHRSDSKALVLLASDMDMICRFVKVIPDIAVQLVEVNDRPMTLIYPGAIHGKAPAEGEEEAGTARRGRGSPSQFGSPVGSGVWPSNRAG